MSDFPPAPLSSGGEPAVEVFLGRDRRAAGERALVLQAQGIPHQLVPVGRGVALVVPVARAEQALRELASYERENVDWPPARPAPPLLSSGVSGAVVYSVILLAFAPIARTGLFGRNWWEAGKLVAGRVRDGELGRAATALCLHADAAHLVGNLVFGCAFGVLAAHTMGLGVTWAGVLAAGFLGNLTNAWLQEATHSSIGASTAVFGCLGLMSSYEWMRRRALSLPPMRRYAPLLAAAALFGFFGAGEGQGDARTDVVAHVTGAGWGMLLGALTGALRLPERLGSRAQRALALLVVALLAAAWVSALA